MIVHLTAAAATVLDADDCTRLHVSTDLLDTEIGEALRVTGTGRIAADNTALLALDVLRTRAQAAASASNWAERWDGMVAYAARKGWLTEDGTAVQAHIETSRQERM